MLLKKSMEFYSEPSSPKQCISPFERSRANSTIDEFEFGTSCRFDFNDVDFNQVDRNKQRKQSEGGDSLPAMAFADELFADGKVLPLLPRLKLPPRLEHRHDNRSSGRSSTASSPRSPVSALKIKFVHQNLWNDDFDPFLVALQSVKEDEAGKTRSNNHGPAPAHSPQRPNNSTDQQPSSGNGPVESPKTLTEPKGLAFARAVLQQMDHETGRRFSTITMSGSILKSNDIRRDSKWFYTRKRNKLMKLVSLIGKLGLKSTRSAP